jgi:hypothetical protein
MSHPMRRTRDNLPVASAAAGIAVITSSHDPMGTARKANAAPELGGADAALP